MLEEYVKYVSQGVTLAAILGTKNVLDLTQIILIDKRKYECEQISMCDKKSFPSIIIENIPNQPLNVSKPYRTV